MKFLNWLLYEVHRWLGIAVALFMFVWFFTGLVIMYSTQTTQTHTQQLAHAENLGIETGWLSVGDAWQRSAEQRKALVSEHKKPEGMAGMGDMAAKPAGAKSGPVGIADARLLRINSLPIWLVEDTRGQRFSLSAIDGSVQQTTEQDALKIAQNWYKDQSQEPIKLSYLESIDTPALFRNQDASKPFHHIAVGDAGDEIYISARTGEVINFSTRSERAFYWAGNWLHLFKPLDLFGLGDIRHDVQVWSGFIATIACLTGLIIGWLRWRPGFNGKRTYSEGRTQPYREFWLKWHFWTGLIGGTVALFWALSGYIDTNPGKIFSDGNYSREEISKYVGSDLPEVIKNWQPLPLAVTENDKEPVELNWRRLGSEAVLLAYGRDGQRVAQAIDNAAPQFSKEAVLAGINRVQANVEAENYALIEDYDSYYYPRHNQTRLEKPLPVVLVTLADQDGTRLYIDPQDGRMLGKYDQSRRVFRWLYSALHHWDFGWLYYRPIWDIWMIVWISFGLVLGASSLVIGWRRLTKTFKPKKQKARRPAVRPDLVTESAAE